MLDDTIEAFKTRDKELASQTEPQEEIDGLKDALRKKHIERLNQQKCNHSTGVLFLDIVTNL